MKTITKERKCYEFKELDQNVQEKLIEQEKKNLEDTYIECWLQNDMTYFAEKLLKKYFGDNAKFKSVLYDLSYFQGSGAMIEFDLTYYNKFVQIRNYGHYTHENSFKINNYDLTDKQEQTLKAKIYKMNCELKDYGYSQIEYWWEADEEAIENLKEYEFYKNGEIY